VHSVFTNRLIQITSAILLPVAAIYLAGRREATIALDFLQYELLSHSPLIVVLLLVAAAIFFLTPRIDVLKASARHFQRSFQDYKRLWIICSIIILASFLPYLNYRYKIYSQISFQRNALVAIHGGDYIKAKSICRSYLTLYPQRSKNGVIPDDICVPYLQFHSRMDSLYSYLAALKTEKEMIDGLEIPVDWNAKKYALHLVGEWKGVRGQATELSTKQVPLAVPSTLAYWAEGESPETAYESSQIQGTSIADSDGSAPNTCHFSLQAGSFSDVSRARRLSDRLRELAGRDVVLQSAEVRGKTFTRVIIPCLSTKQEARAVSKMIGMESAIIRRE
jgi:hypothetical protein